MRNGGLTMLALMIQLAIANPASVYCVQQGGRVEIVDTKKGQIGICILPDGRRIEEWKLFRSKNQPARG
jgi:uncharacterized protein